MNQAKENRVPLIMARILASRKIPQNGTAMKKYYGDTILGLRVKGENCEEVDTYHYPGGNACFYR